MSGACRAEWVTTRAGMARLLPEWDALWRECPDATPFQSPAWLASWAEIFAPALALLAVRRSGRLAGLAPFWIDGEAESARLLPLGVPVTDYHDILLAPDCAPEAASAIADRLGGQNGWASLEMDDLPEGCRALALPCPASCEEQRQPSSVCPYLELPRGAGELPGVLPPRKRRSIRMNGHRAARRGPVEMLSLAERGAPDMLADLFRLHGLRWRDRGEDGVLAEDDIQRFHLLAAPRLAEAGVLRCYAIRIGGQIAAVYYGFLRGARAYAYLSGFDPAFARESPGTLIVAHAIEEAVREGARELDFLRGGEDYKYGWGARDRRNVRRRFIRRGGDHAN